MKTEEKSYEEMAGRPHPFSIFRPRGFKHKCTVLGISFAHALKLTSNANSNANSMTNSMLAERAGCCTACSVWGAISVKYSGLVVALKALRTADPRQHGGQGVAAYPATIGRAIVVIGLPGEATMKAA